MQMAVSGLSLCDFFVLLANESHLETVYFDEEFWQQKINLTCFSSIII
jgi:hypothetical protein